MIARRVATFGLLGRIPVAASTCASLAALATGYLLHWLGGFPLLFAAAAVLGGLGLWATRAEDGLDRSEIVIDEVVGQWVALMPLSAGLWHAGAPAHVFPWPGWVSAFLLFRLFDVWKPWPVSWAHRREGVMLDDVIAGLMAAAVTAALAAVAHGRVA